MISRHKPRRRVEPEAKPVFDLRQNLMIQSLETEGPVRRCDSEQEWDLRSGDWVGCAEAFMNGWRHEFCKLADSDPPLGKFDFPRRQIGARFRVPEVGLVNVANPTSQRCKCGRGVEADTCHHPSSHNR